MGLENGFLETFREFGLEEMGRLAMLEEAQVAFLGSLDNMQHMAVVRAESVIMRRILAVYIGYRNDRIQAGHHNMEEWKAECNEMLDELETEYANLEDRLMDYLMAAGE